MDQAAPKVFLSYRSLDAEAVEAFARRLVDSGVDAWFDRWEIAAGDNIVTRMTSGVDGCHAALVFVSSTWFDGKWAWEELTQLILRKVEDGIRVIPVTLEEGLDRRLPAALRTLARRSVDDFDAIRDALLGIDHKPGLRSPLRLDARRVTITLGDDSDGLATVALTVEDEARAAVDGVPVPAGLTLAGAPHGLSLGELGRRVGRVVFAGEVGAVVESLVDSLDANTLVDVCVEAAPGPLIALPMEAALLVSGRAPALHPGVRLWRRMTGARRGLPAPAPGPLKVLVAVGAPDEGYTPNVPLDVEAEMGSILEAVSPAVRDGRAQVRILEVADPDAIRDALAEDDYHVLHLSGHGGPREIELEDEDGQAVPVSADELVAAFQAGGKALPLVFVSSCNSGGDSASLAVELHHQGVPRVLAMQAPVTDVYATALARVFYRELSRASSPRAGVALAVARQEVEAMRKQAAAELRPEWATASLLLAGDDDPLIDSDLEQTPLRRPPVHAIAGPVPSLGWDELIGRRREVRIALRALRGDDAFTAEHGEVGGVVLTGIGGVGKSSVAGRVWTRLAEEGWVCSATRGAFSLEAIYRALTADLADAPLSWAHDLSARLSAVPDDDQARLDGLGRTLQRFPLLLILDNFEDNLTVDGGAFLDPARAAVLEALLDCCSVGKLLVTSRYPLPGLSAGVHELAVGPLSPAETRRLFLRLEGLKQLGREDVTLVSSLIGGHPRVLEFLDALLRRGASVKTVRSKLRDLARSEAIDPRDPRALPQAIEDAVRLGAADIFLKELLTQLDDAEREVLLQTAVSNISVPLEDLAETLDELGLSAEATQRAAERLIELSLIARVEGELWVHRWTAEALREHQPEDAYRERCDRAGELRVRRIQRASRSIDEGIEATENFLVAGSTDRAATVAKGVVAFLEQRSTLARLSFAAQVRAALPRSDPNYNIFVDHEATALFALGFSLAAIERYTELAEEQERRALAEPERLDYQHDVSVVCERLADLMLSVGQGQRAFELFTRSLEIRERLVAQEPDSTQFRRGLAVTYNKLGDVLARQGREDRALELFTDSLEIRRQLAEAEPDNAEFRRDLSVGYNKLGDLIAALGDAERALELFSEDLLIAQQLAEDEPDRVAYQRDLAISYDRVGDMVAQLDDTDRALELYTQALDIRERLVDIEPDRTDYRRDLALSYFNLGDLMHRLDRGERVLELYLQGLEIVERLAKDEPDRVDHQHDLSVTYSKLGDYMAAVGQPDEAGEYYLQDLAITERIAAGEPGRADYQRDLSISYDRLAKMMVAAGDKHRARQYYTQSVTIRRRLRDAAPDNPDRQRELEFAEAKLNELDGD